ncbi:uncharacterized protein LOC113797096 [Dermatophagoides pteronyssinus]|uniref:Uncharacterized protein LOC113797096 n=2 Tax=Dermatophagoides pteronyssinus TaxID=6956 RepID=A0A6P6YCP4_DERPT|nr:uncharacterized protein LOC113797096 [Dermatophagoides pteronyssinus]KAH9416714.1 hypothetical protein DERP_012182 [Dermatophagoides pteronyssinus]
MNSHSAWMTISIRPDVSGSNMQNIEHYRERMMAHVSSTLCAFFLFIIFILIEQAQLLEFNYDEEFIDADRPSALRYHLPYEHDIYEDVYDHETSQSQYGEYRPDTAFNQMDDYVQQQQSESDPTLLDDQNNYHDNNDDDDESQTSTISSNHPNLNPFQTAQSVAVQEINTRSGHFRWRILADMNAKSSIVR